jgi:hypothetical protein
MLDGARVRAHLWLRDAVVTNGGHIPLEMHIRALEIADATSVSGLISTT